LIRTSRPSSGPYEFDGARFNVYDYNEYRPTLYDKASVSTGVVRWSVGCEESVSDAHVERFVESLGMTKGAWFSSRGENWETEVTPF